MFSDYADTVKSQMLVEKSYRLSEQTDESANPNRQNSISFSGVNLMSIFKRMFIAVIGLSLLFVLGLPATQVRAEAVEICRADPIVVFSDGSVMVWAADIGASASAIKSIDYVLHAPAGVKVVSVTYTEMAGFHGKERFKLKNDAPAGTFVMDTLVRTRSGVASVAANVQYQGQTVTASGASGQHVVARLNAQ